MNSPVLKTVFVVDDSPLIRERLTAMISADPEFRVIGFAEIAFEAIEAVRQLKPDIVVLDISMPGCSGMYVLETIKKEKPSPRVIMLTNFANDQYRQKCRQLGADHFFDKSTELDHILEALRSPSAPPAA